MSTSPRQTVEVADQSAIEDDLYPGDRLERVIVHLSPKRSPDHLARPAVSSSSARISKIAKRKRKAQPSASDAYLLMNLEPNRPDIYRQAATQPLDVHTSGDDSMGEAEEEEDLDTKIAREMAEKEQAEKNHQAEEEHRRQERERQEREQAVLRGLEEARLREEQERQRQERERLDLEKKAQMALDLETAQSNDGKQLSPVNRFKTEPSEGLCITVPIRNQEHGLPNPAKFNNGLVTPLEPRRMSLSHQDSLNTSPLSAHLKHADSDHQRLPALQSPGATDGPGSPQREKLPSFGHIAEIADKANGEIIRQRQNSMSMGAPSPYTNGIGRSPYSFAQPSPAASETSPRSGLPMGSPQSGIPGSMFYNRRPSVAGEYPAGLPSASSTENSYASTDGHSPYSPSTQPTPQSETHRLSIDGTINGEGRPILPPPIPSLTPLAISTVPAHGSGGFSCDFPGCTAAPFQTQYLLNSHANVHSSNRPHYCPVQGCPRGAGGKGFKRKNEMIRHGLVHDSPGYVCPFCPDREHKYPRPDNLQRHVRVHHMEVHKDDATLRQVLAQRPEGGNRGRRRRLGS